MMNGNPSYNQQEKNMQRNPNKRWKKQSENESEAEDKTKNEPNLIRLLEGGRTFKEQLEIFQLKHCLSLDFMNKRYVMMCEDLKKILNKLNIRNYTLQPFGSYVTDLLFKTSDIDIFLRNENFFNMTNQQQRSYAKNTVNRLTKLIHIVGSNCFFNVKPIPNARVPIVKFDHRPTGLSIDINFTEFIGPINCELIAKMYKFSYKVRDAMLILKYWGLSQGFVAQCKMSSYQLNLMFIFYLQTKNLLPSVYDFQNQRNLSLKFMNKWMISNDYPESFHVQSFDTVDNLLKGFFKFYAEFDFFSNIICPYLGVVVHKSRFLNFNSVPSEFYYYKQICRSEPLNVDVFLCVQDLFIHNRCITSSKLDDKTYWLFLDKLDEANEIFQNNEPTDILPKLLNVNSSKNRLRSTTLSYGFRLPSKLLNLGKKVNYSLRSFHNEFKNVLLEILRDIFCFNCDISDYHNMDTIPFKLILNCSALFNIWASRKQTNKFIFPNAYEYEKNLSFFLLKNQERKLKTPIIFKTQFLLNTKRLNLDIQIEVIQPKTSNNINALDSTVYNFLIFFKSKIESIIYLYSQYKISNMLEINLDL